MRRTGRRIARGSDVPDHLPAVEARSVGETLHDLGEMRRRTLAYAYHTRETNLATAMRHYRGCGAEIPLRLCQELQAVLEADQANQQQPEPIASALGLLRADVDAFLRTYFTVVPDAVSKGHFSLTSR